MSVALSNELERDQLEQQSAMMESKGISNSSDLAKYYYLERAQEVINAQTDYMKYIQFIQTNIFLKGTGTDVDSDGRGEMK